MKKEENGTEEIYLMPETETSEADKPLTETTTASKNTEKFVFTVFYALAEKEVILSQLKRMGAVIVHHSDKDGAVTAKMTMAQLAAIKTLECVERVEVAQTVKQSKKSLTNTETQAMLNTQQTYAATANASVSRANTNNDGVSLLCYDDGGYSGGDCSNDISTAIHLPLSTWMSGGIYCPGAEMWYRFTASVSNAAEYSIYTTGSLDTVGYLYDANGDYITENDDNDGMNFGITSELTYGATYYICVQAYSSNTGDFSLRVDYTTESDSSGDGSNDMSTAIELPLSTYVSGSLDCPGTEMWYSFTASVSNAAEYSIYTTGDLDTVGYLYDSNGDYITDNDDSGGDLNFSITSQLTYGETYYVCVSAYSGNTGSYDIRVDYETLSEEPDDDGYSNDMSSAINLSLNSWHSGEIYCPGDEMWYKFTPSTTAYYTLYTVGSLDTVGHIYDADCNLLDGDDDAGAGLNFKMVARLTAGQTYYVQVAAYADNTGCFNIAVTNTVFVEYVTIDQSYINLDKGETVTLTATVVPSYATNKTLHWETSDSSVATVNQSGVVTARGAGTACICAYSQDGSNKSSCCEVWVNVPVKSVTINATSLLMRVGEQEDLDAEICPTDAVNQLIRWTSTDTSVVWVNEATGQVEARGEGSATVYATAQDGTGVRGNCAIQVEPPIVPPTAVQGIDICCDNYTMKVGETTTLTATVVPSYATNKTVTWRSSNENVVTVELRTGRITAKRAGSATITVTTEDGGFVARCSVTVNQILTGADVYIDDEETRNLIVQYKKVNDYIQVAYLSGEINDTQKNEQQSAVEEAINLARADYVILKPQSNFVYQFFQGRNHTDDDLCPFIRESYTYPNAGYNSSKDTLAITIIQRALELLTYFEPPNEYVYGAYDIDTHNALLSSPFYMLGTNDFQKYSYYDMLGSTTTNERTKDNIKTLHKMRLFHNEVVAWVAEKVQPKSRTNNTTIYKNPEHTKWGFADVMKTAAVNEYIWEVKPWSQRYRILNGMAAIQLNGYITAWNNNEIDQKYSPRLPALPGYHIGKFAFRSKLANKIIVVESNAAVAPDIRSGLVHYYPTENDAEYQREFATVYALEEEAVTVPVPAYSYNFATPISFGDWQIKGMAQVAGAAVLVIAIGTVLYFCSPSLLPGVFPILAATGA